MDEKFRQMASASLRAYLRVLGRKGIVRGALLEAAPAGGFIDRKWPCFVQARLREMPGVRDLYALT